ncbi:MAG: exodeoxyribonuclease V subunit gamma, partial [Planctomycetes bacterium]|nr:exodeoxyribonuclease V subunit gamma [Planctomycetota bacterium]
QGVHLYTEYQNRLIAHHLYDLEGRFWYARDLLSRDQRRPFEKVRAVFVDGFTDFTRTQHEILDALSRWVEDIWITLPYEPDPGRTELFTRPRTTLERLRHLEPRMESLSASGQGIPAGLAHVERQLFRPVRSIQQADRAEGIRCLTAPGLVGEVRLGAREIKTLLLEGVPAEEILVAVRDLAPYADLVREIFTDYGIPVDIEGTEPLLRNPAVATLLRVLRLPDEDWPFAAVTALLRSTYFCPAWPEVEGRPDLAQQAEALLRLLGEPRGREAYLKATESWAERPLPGLEDEQAEESRRQRTHELAKRCRAFLQHFFRAWEGAPAQATLADHGAWLRHFAHDMGLEGVAAADARDARALARFWEELDQWTRLEGQLQGGQPLRDRRWFVRTLTSLAAEAGLARTPRGPGRVRVLSAPLARSLPVPYLFLMGLGERGFPRLVPPEVFFEEPERRVLQQAGLDLPFPGDPMADEMLLFYQLVTNARRQLVLSYPAVDDKGQALLPSMFLTALLECFAPNVVSVQGQRMLIEGFDRRKPLSPAEYRVLIAISNQEAAPNLLPDLAANLQAAAHMARARFQNKEFNPYDGLLRHPGVMAELSRQFGPEKIFSPTALEDYIACPFRFFLGNVLHLDPLEEPQEEIESTKRGAAFHRALSRLHEELGRAGIHQPAEEVDRHLQQQLDRAVEEYAARGSPASEVLWRLEGRRLKRLGDRYRPHWDRFVKPWLPQGVQPRPHLLEVGFGMPSTHGETVAGPLVITQDGIEVRIRGRIDRVDVADLEDGTGFWIIDYKTGRAGHYTGSDLKNFQRLQLTLYALAVEQVLLAGQQARPLGLAYWLVADGGPKVALPARNPFTWFQETAAWGKVREQLLSWVATLVSNIRQGTFPLKPRSRECTATCDFSQVCRITQSRSVEKTWELPLPTEP